MGGLEVDLGHGIPEEDDLDVCIRLLFDVFSALFIATIIFLVGLYLGWWHLW